MDPRTELTSFSLISGDRLTRFVHLTLNELALKLDDVALYSGSNTVELSEFRGVFKSASFCTKQIESIFNHLINLQIQYGNCQMEYLSIPFILEYLSPIIFQSIQSLKLPPNWSDEIFDEILSEVIRLVFTQTGDDGEDDVSSLYGTNYSESTVNIFNLRDHIRHQHELLHQLIKSLMNLSKHFPIQQRLEVDMDREDDLNLMNDLMAHSTTYSSPDILRIRVRKKRNLNRKKSYDLVDDEYSSGSGGAFDEHRHDEGVSMKDCYDTVFAKYRLEGLPQQLLELSLKIVSLPADRRDIVLRAINLCDAATRMQSSPVYKKTDKIKAYLGSRGLTKAETQMAIESSLISFESALTLKLNSQSASRGWRDEDIESVSRDHGINHLSLSAAPSRRDSNLEQHDIGYNMAPRHSHLAAPESTAESQNVIEDDTRECSIKCGTLTLILLMTTICGMLTVAQLSTTNSTQWLSFLYFAAYLLVTVSFFFFGCSLCIGRAMRCQLPYSFNISATEHRPIWFISTVLSQCILLAVESLRLRRLRGAQLIWFTSVVCCYCLMSSPLIMMVTLSYHHAMTARRSMMLREIGIQILLVFEVAMEMVFILCPLIALVDGDNAIDIGDGIYFQIMDVLRCSDSLEWILCLIPMILIRWHCVDIVRVIERRFNTVLIPKAKTESKRKNGSTRFSLNADMLGRGSKSSHKPPPKEAVANLSPKVQPMDKCGSISAMNPDPFEELSEREVTNEHGAVMSFTDSDGVSRIPRLLDKNELLSNTFRTKTDSKRREIIERWSIVIGLTIGMLLILYGLTLILWVVIRCI